MSRFLSLVLRHKPEVIGLELSKGGWARVPELITKIKASGRSIKRSDLERIVNEDDKQHYSLDQKTNRIRANQGHSIPVDLGFVAQTPPEQLYHGTATRYLESIMDEGLDRRNRQYVHLSSELETAKRVGARHGKVVVLSVAAGKMVARGMEFYLSENGVWLTEKVAVEFLSVYSY